MARMTQKQTTTDEEAKQIQNLHIEAKTEGKRSAPSGRLNAEKVGIALESILKIKDNKLPSSTTEDDIENDSFSSSSSSSPSSLSSHSSTLKGGSSSDDNNKRKTKTTTDGGLVEGGSSHHLPHHNYSEHHTDRLNTNLVVVGQQGPALPPSMKKVFLEENEMNKITTNSMSDQTRTITSRTPKDFFFINVLGEGSFSTVYYSKEVDTGDEYAIKVLLKSEIRREGRARYVLREKDIMALLTYFYGGHPFIIRLYCTFQDNDRLYFALAYAKHGELLDWLRRLGSFDEEATLFYASEILCALEFLHKCKIIHRDLKPENILVGKDWHIMLSDFGTSKIINSEQTNKEQLPQQILDDVTTTLPPPPTSSPNKNSGGVRSSFVGTAHYISPEVLKSEDVGSECDYWALGAIIFQMISGQPPFRAVNEYKILKKILGLDFHFPEGFPSIAKQLVSGLLVYKPSERLGSAANGGIEALKRHEFFKNVNWENIFTRKPPELKPYLPASCGEPAFYSDYNPLSGNIEPGLNEAALYRLMGLGPSVGGGGGGCTSLRGFMDFDCIEDFLPSTCSIPPSASASSSCSSFSSTPTTSSFQTSTDLNDTTNLLLFSNLTEEERERRRKCQLERQKQEHKYHQFVQNNLILKCGLIDKKKGLFARRRMFLLTEGPHLFYVDPVSMHLKGEVPFSAQMRTEAKNFRTFFVHTPKRTYYLFDPERHAKDWCDAIDWAREQHFSSLNKSKDKVSTKTIGQTCDNQGGGNIQNISSVTKLFSGRTKSPSSGVE